MAISPVERAEELQLELRTLAKATADIEEGWKRLHEQCGRLADLQAAGYDTRQAEQLVSLLEQTLVEWERHRTLIDQRIAYLLDSIE